MLCRIVPSIAARRKKPIASITTIAMIGKIQSCCLRIVPVRENDRPIRDLTNVK